MAQNGVFNGLMYILLLNMSAHITRELGMAPGGEFRRAMAEVCTLYSLYWSTKYRNLMIKTLVRTFYT